MGEIFARNGATRYQPLIRHYDGSSWKVVTIPRARFSSQWVAASSAKNVWVFGFTPNPRHIASSTAYRYDGSHWHKVAVPALTARQDPVVLSPANVWAFGSSGSLSLPGDVFHWNGAGTAVYRRRQAVMSIHCRRSPFQKAPLMAFLPKKFHRTI